MNILVGVTGSIAAYKAASVVSALHKQGHDVRVCMTKAAREFVGPVTFSALSHNPVILDEDEFKPDGHIMHIEMAQEWAHILVIAPASYDFIGKVTSYRADDALSSICAAWPDPILLCPAMNTVMWENLSKSYLLKDSVHWVGKSPVKSEYRDSLGDKLRFEILYPAKGALACGTVGVGAMRPTKDIVDFINGFGKLVNPTLMDKLNPRD